jgi:hypothetical protein
MKQRPRPDGRRRDRDRYTRPLADMVYGRRAEFDEAFATVADLASDTWR